MNNRHYSAVFAGLAALAAILPTAAQAEPPAGRLLASQCAQCHGTNGNSVGEIDSLAGKSYSDLYNDLLEMKYSSDLNDIMHRQAKGYSAEQLDLIAKYFASQPGSGHD